MHTLLDPFSLAVNSVTKIPFGYPCPAAPTDMNVCVLVVPTDLTKLNSTKTNISLNQWSSEEWKKVEIAPVLRTVQRQGLDDECYWEWIDNSIDFTFSHRIFPQAYDKDPSASTAAAMAKLQKYITATYAKYGTGDNAGTYRSATIVGGSIPCQWPGAPASIDACTYRVKEESLGQINFNYVCYAWPFEFKPYGTGKLGYIDITGDVAGKKKLLGRIYNSTTILPGFDMTRTVEGFLAKWNQPYNHIITRRLDAIRAAMNADRVNFGAIGACNAAQCEELKNVFRAKDGRVNNAPKPDSDAEINPDVDYGNGRLRDIPRPK